MLLDEPTLGLDVQSRRQVWQLVQELKQSGTTVIVTTHYIEEAERLCDKIALIHHGRLVGFDTPDALRRLVLGEQHRLEIVMKDEPTAWPDDLSLLPEKSGLGIWSFVGEPAELFQTAALLHQHFADDIVETRYIEPTLEEVFVRLTGGDGPSHAKTS